MGVVVLPGPALDPLEAAARLAGLPGRFLLHSASDADGVGRWSFVGAEPAAVVDALEDVDAALARCEAVAAVDGEAPQPLLVGFLSYDLWRRLEPGSVRSPAATGDVPDVWLGVYHAVWRHDGVKAEIVGEEAAALRLRERLSTPSTATDAPLLGPLLEDEPSSRHLAAVARALEYIAAGDVYQVNLARRLSARLRRDGDALALYRAVARVAPAPYGALLEAGAVRVISDSPELFLRREAGSTRVETRPIKGTRARGSDAAEDVRLAAELRASEKELAEHLMIVDLLRNDLGRVARIGSVRVDDFARVVSLPTVLHLISTVSATIPAPAGELLAATFPGGSVTGAPKIRALQIIDELEPHRRGVYTGAIGYLGARGALDLAIAIRTAVLVGDALHLHVGGGIVADSTPQRELEETEEKAAGWRRALAYGKTAV